MSIITELEWPDPLQDETLSDYLLRVSLYRGERPPDIGNSPGRPHVLSFYVENPPSRSTLNVRNLRVNDDMSPSTQKITQPAGWNTTPYGPVETWITCDHNLNGVISLPNIIKVGNATDTGVDIGTPRTNKKVGFHIIGDVPRSFLWAGLQWGSGTVGVSVVRVAVDGVERGSLSVNPAALGWTWIACPA